MSWIDDDTDKFHQRLMESSEREHERLLELLDKLIEVKSPRNERFLIADSAIIDTLTGEVYDRRKDEELQ